MSYQLELRHFKYFKAVAEELSFRKASESLFISQPGLSRQIQQMEETLDAQLFIRSKRSVELTSAGKYLLGEVTELLEKVDSIQRQVSLIDKGESGELRIGFLGSAVQKVLPGFLLKLKESLPDVHATLDEMNNGAQIELIQQGKLDLGFVRVAKVPEPLKIRPVITDTFSLVLPANHALTSESYENVRQLEKEDFILFSREYSPLYYNQIMSIFEDQGFTPKISHKSVHALTIFKLVESGLGVAIIPSTLKAGFDMKIKFIELDQIVQKTTLSAIWNANNHNPIIDRVIDLIFE